MLLALSIALRPAASVTSLLRGRPRPQVTKWYAAHLREGATRGLPPAGTVTLHCREGEAWVTQDGSLKDVVLAPQESYRLPPGQQLFVHALHGACVLEVQVEE